METFNAQTWKSRKLWTCIVVLIVGVVVSILQPTAATVGFYSFLLAIAALYIGGNLGEYVIKGPLLDAKSESTDE